jgi:hypothetical protein
MTERESARVKHRTTMAATWARFELEQQHTGKQGRLANSGLGEWNATQGAGACIGTRRRTTAMDDVPRGRASSTRTGRTERVGSTANRETGYAQGQRTTRAKQAARRRRAGTRQTGIRGELGTARAQELHGEQSRGAVQEKPGKRLGHGDERDSARERSNHEGAGWPWQAQEQEASTGCCTEEFGWDSAGSWLGALRAGASSTERERAEGATRELRDAQRAGERTEMRHGWELEQRAGSREAGRA